MSDDPAILWITKLASLSSALHNYAACFEVNLIGLMHHRANTTIVISLEFELVEFSQDKGEVLLNLTIPKPRQDR